MQEPVALGLTDGPKGKVPRRFAVFWLKEEDALDTYGDVANGPELGDSAPSVEGPHRSMIIVGAFMEGGSNADDEAMERIAREQPRLLTLTGLQRMCLDDFLANPHCLTPKVGLMIQYCRLKCGSQHQTSTQGYRLRRALVYSDISNELLVYTFFSKIRPKACDIPKLVAHNLCSNTMASFDLPILYSFTIRN
jgi:uncharacterized protein YifE (UPF0438 family)